MIAGKGDAPGLVAALQAKVPCGWLSSFVVQLGSAAVMWAFDFYTVYVFVLVKLVKFDDTALLSQGLLSSFLSEQSIVFFL